MNKYVSLEHAIRQIVKSTGVGINESVGIIGSSKPVGTPSAFLRPITKYRRFGLDAARTAANQRTAKPQASFEGGKAVTPNYGNVEPPTKYAGGSAESGKKKLKEQIENKEDENTNLDLIRRKKLDGTQPEPVRFKSGLEKEMERAGMPKPSLTFQPPAPTPEQIGAPPPQPAPPAQLEVEQGASPHYGSMERYTNPASEVVPPADIQAIEKGKPPVSAPASVPQSIPAKQPSIQDRIQQQTAGLPQMSGLAGFAGGAGATADALGGAEVLPRLGWPGLAALAGTAAAVYGSHKLRDYMNEPSLSELPQTSTQPAPAQQAVAPKERVAPEPFAQKWLDVKPNLDSPRVMGRGVTTPTQRVGDTPVFDPSLARQFDFTSNIAPPGAQPVGIAPNLTSPHALPSSKTQEPFTSVPAAAQPYIMDKQHRQEPFTSKAPEQAASIIDQQARALPRQQTGMDYLQQPIPAGAAAVGIAPKDNIDQGRFTSPASAVAAAPRPAIENQKRERVQAQFTSKPYELPPGAAPVGIAPNLISPHMRKQDTFTTTGAPPEAIRPAIETQQRIQTGHESPAIAPTTPETLAAAMQKPVIDASIPAIAKTPPIAPPITSPAPAQTASIIDQQARVTPKHHEAETLNAINPSAGDYGQIAPNITSPRALPSSKTQDKFPFTAPADMGAIAPSVAAALPAIEKQARATLPTDPSVLAALQQKPAIDQSTRAKTGKETSEIPPYSINPMATTGQIPLQTKAPVLQASTVAIPKAGTKTDELAPPITGTQAQIGADVQTKAKEAEKTGEEEKDKDKGGGGILPWLGMGGLAALISYLKNMGLGGGGTGSSASGSKFLYPEKGSASGVPLYDKRTKKLMQGKGILAPLPKSESESGVTANPNSGKFSANKDIIANPRNGRFANDPSQASVKPTSNKKQEAPKASNASDLFKHNVDSMKANVPFPYGAQPESGDPKHELKKEIIRKVFEEEVSTGTRERRKLEIVARDMITKRKQNKLQSRQDAYKKQRIDEDGRLDIMRSAIEDAKERRPYNIKKKVNTNGKTPVDTHPTLKKEPLDANRVM